MRNGTTIYVSQQIKSKIETEKEEYEEERGRSVSFSEFLDFLLNQYRERGEVAEEVVEKLKDKGVIDVN